MQNVLCLININNIRTHAFWYSKKPQVIQGAESSGLKILSLLYHALSEKQCCGTPRNARMFKLLKLGIRIFLDLGHL